MKYDIVIPHYGVEERVTGLALKCLKTIREYSQDYRLILVDNGGAKELAEELDKHAEVLLITNATNQGFVKAVNAGLAVATAPYVVLLNNDTEVVPGWLDDLAAPLVGHNAMSGPRTTAQMSWQGRAAPPSTLENVVLSKTAMLAFFCVMFRKDMLEQVGLLDEEFGVGLGDDDNYCARVHAAGFDLVWVTKLMIPHHHRTTFRALYSDKEIEGLQEKALQLHYRKLATLPKTTAATAKPKQGAVPVPIVQAGVKLPRILRIVRAKELK